MGSRAWIGGQFCSYIISQSGLYKLVMRSAKQFQDWVRGEALPEFREAVRQQLRESMEAKRANPRSSSTGCL